MAKKAAVKKDANPEVAALGVVTFTVELAEGDSVEAVADAMANAICMLFLPEGHPEDEPCPRAWSRAFYAVPVGA